MAMVKNLLIISLVAAGVIGMQYQQKMSFADEKKFQPLGRMVDIGGYKLHMIDSKTGPVSVVMDSAIGGKTLDWCLVQPEIAKFARVITYDRAGYAWSDPSSLARTSGNIVQELHTMLHNAKIQPPYVLVGDGFGGMNMRLFADQYPEEVAGLVLMNVDQDGCVPHKFGLLHSLWLYCVDAANYLGCLRLLSLLPSHQQKMHDAIAKYPVYLAPIYATQTLTTTYIHAMVQEELSLPQSCQQIKQAQTSFDNKPFVVMNTCEPSALITAVDKMVYAMKLGNNA